MTQEDAPFRPALTSPAPRRKYLSGCVEKVEDWEPNPPLPEMSPLYDNAIVAAAKALADGRAEPYQQTLILDWFLNRACRVRDWHYIPGDPRATDILTGMQKPAHDFLKLVTLRAPGQSETEQG